MSGGRRVLRRRQAQQDVDQAVVWYLEQQSARAALGFVDALEQAIAHISEHPAAGSQRYALELNLPDLRAWPLKTYPYLIFYVVTADSIDIWRVLHNRRDIPAWLALSD